MAKTAPFDPELHYDNSVGHLTRLAGEVVFALQAEIAKTDIKTHSITSRVKTRASYLDKIRRKDYSDPLAQVEDLVGARVVCLFTTDLPKLRMAIAKQFQILSEEDKVNGGDPDTFGYMSIHYVCKLSGDTKGARYEGLADFKFEIQCRTILMDAWANVSHYLAYKNDISIPIEIRRPFNALAGLFYVADREFESIYDASSKSDAEAQAQAQTTLEGSNDSRQQPTPLNRSTLSAYLGVALPSRTNDEVAAVSELVKEIAELGVSSIQELARALDPAWSLAEEYEEKYPPSARTQSTDSDDDLEEDEDDPGVKGRFTAVGLCRMALAIVYPKYVEARYHSDRSFSPFRARLQLGAKQ